MQVKNRLLDTDLIIYQNDDWFKFSLDSVLLSRFVTINLRHKKIIDLATGNAPIPLLLTFRTNASIYGIEYQKCIYQLAKESVEGNNLSNQINLINDDVSNISKHFDSESFDVVTCNPPYFKANNDKYFNSNDVKTIARHEVMLCLDEVLKKASFLLKTGGVFAMVHRTERFVEIIEKMRKYNLEPKRVRFIYPKIGRESDLMLIEGIKNGHGGLKLLSPLVVHNEDNTYTAEVLEMLNFGKR